MAGYRLRSWQKPTVGRVLITVALDGPAKAAGFEQHRRIESFTRELLEHLTRAALPATWGVSDPVHAAATPALENSRILHEVAHEIAVIGDATWVGPSAGRPRFAKELARRVNAARAKGLPASSLLLQKAVLGDDLDLVVKRGITAVCHIDQDGSAPTQTRNPRSLHYGVWEMPPTGHLPTKPGWLAARRLVANIRRVARDGGFYHMCIAAPAVVSQPAGVRRRLSRVLQDIAKLRDRGLLKVETLAAAATRLSDVPATTPQRSLLRQAA